MNKWDYIEQWEDVKKKTRLKREEWGGRSDNQKDKAEEGGNGWKLKWN